MNREIKFRGWNKKTKEYNRYVEIYSYKDGSTGCSAGRHNNMPIGNSENFILEQFTGLKDKNKKEVYEGDIVLFPNNSKVHIVDFHQSGFVLKSVDGQIVVYNIKPQYIEVVGNIYENAELVSVSNAT